MMMLALAACLYSLGGTQGFSKLYRRIGTSTFIGAAVNITGLLINSWHWQFLVMPFVLFGIYTEPYSGDTLWEKVTKRLIVWLSFVACYFLGYWACGFSSSGLCVFILASIISFSTVILGGSKPLEQRTYGASHDLSSKLIIHRQLAVLKMIKDNEYTRMTKQHEGLRLTPYRDPTKKGTVYSVGYGHNLSASGEALNPITLPQAENMFSKDYIGAEDRAANIVGERYNGLTPSQQAILNDMSFQMGDKLGGFHNMIKAINTDRFGDVPKEMLDSEWARQTPGRANDLAARWSQ